MGNRNFVLLVTHRLKPVQDNKKIRNIKNSNIEIHNGNRDRNNKGLPK